MRTVIVEDERLNADRIRDLLAEISPGTEVLAMPDSVRSAVDWFRNHEPPDLVFMDIQLGDGISFDIFEQCEVKAPVIFITAYQEYAIRAFKVHSVDYLLKPVNREDLQSALEKYTRHFKDPQKPDVAIDPALLGNIRKMLTRPWKSRFMVKVGEHIRSVDIADVLFFYSMDKGTFLHTSDHRNYVIDYTLDSLNSELDPNKFFRINRKYIISTAAISDLIHLSGSKLKVILSGSPYEEVYISRDRIGGFKQWLDH